MPDTPLKSRDAADAQGEACRLAAAAVESEIGKTSLGIESLRA
jgi:hypothetical protein